MISFDVSMKRLMRNLEEYRLEHRLTQEALANLLGVAYVTVNRWLNGHHQPSKIQAYQIKKLIAAKGRKK